jgi:LCP family protein required for cell wall assembly
MTGRQPASSRRPQPGPRESSVTGNRSLIGSPLVAAALSLLFPGLGQAAAGDRRRGLIVAIPMFAILGAFLVVLVFFRKSILDNAFNQAWLTSLLIVDLVALPYHLWAVVDAYLLAGKDKEQRKSSRRRNGPGMKWGTALGVAVIVSGTVVMHAGTASVDLDWQHTVQCIQALTPCNLPTFAPGETFSLDTSDPIDQVVPSGSDVIASDSPTPVAPAGSLDLSSLPSFFTPPNAQNWAADGQFNVLMLGVDYEPTGGSRSSGLRPDTMVVLHMDIKTGQAAMISIPRNTVCTPLPQDIGIHYVALDAKLGCPSYTWPYMLNWLGLEAGWGGVTVPSAVKNFPFYQDATAGQLNDPMAFPRAIEATSEAIETLTHLTIDGYIMINIEGLSTLIDDLGGIDITVPSTIVDYPCGPSGTWEAKWRVCDLLPGIADKNNPNKAHSGYQVPPGYINEMVADAAKSGGKQTITWKGSTSSTNGTDIAFVIKPGLQHMDGAWAVAYARSRIYYTDYDRNLRQQLVLKSLRSSLDPCKVLSNIGNLGALIGSLSMFQTSLPLDDVSSWAGLAEHVLGNNVQSFDLYYTTLGARAGVTYLNAGTISKAQDIVAHSLDNAPVSSSSSGGGGGGLSC